MLLAVSVAAGAMLFVGILLCIVFRSLDPKIVADDHVPCLGGWHEQELVNCQAGLSKLPQQPVNTYTNLAYLGAGLFFGVWLDVPASYVFVYAMTYLCVGSALYHAMTTRWAGMLDVTGIYVVYASTASFAACVLFGAPDWLTPILMFAVSAIAAWLLWPKFKKDMEWKIGFFLAGTYGLVALRMGVTGDWSPWPWVVASLGTFVLGFLCWILDKKRKFPSPRWGHGLWHLLTAAASGLLFFSIDLTAS